MITWDHDTYDVGVREIDDQHQRLADIINRIEQALSAGENMESVGALLDLLLQYAEFHFFTEEHYMRQHAYQGEASHREGHHHLVDQLLSLRQDLVKQDEADARHTIDFLGSWFLDHILHMDRPMGIWLRARGVR